MPAMAQNELSSPMQKKNPALPLNSEEAGSFLTIFCLQAMWITN